MHSNLHYELYRAEAADRARRAPGAVVPMRRQHPPPDTRRAAYVAARLASRLDQSRRRRAVA